MTEPLNLEPESDQPQVNNVTQARVEYVKADRVRMHQSAAQTIEAAEVELHQAAAADVKAVKVSAHEAALGMVQATDVRMQNSGAAVLRARDAKLNGYAGIVVAERADLGNTYAGAVIAQDIRGERIETILLLARHVDGDVTTLVDTRLALIAGMAAGLSAGVLFLLGRSILGRES